MKEAQCQRACRPVNGRFGVIAIGTRERRISTHSWPSDLPEQSPLLGTDADRLNGNHGHTRPPREWLGLADGPSKFQRVKLKAEADIIIRLQSGAVSLVLTISRLIGIPF